MDLNQLGKWPKLKLTSQFDTRRFEVISGKNEIFGGFVNYYGTVSPRSKGSGSASTNWPSGRWFCTWWVRVECGAVRRGRRPTLLCPHEATPPLFNPTPTSSAAAPRAPDWREQKSALLHPRAHHAPRLHFFQYNYFYLPRGWCQYLTPPRTRFSSNFSITLYMYMGAAHAQ